MALDESKIRFIKLIVASLGIFVSFFIFGIFQERITRVNYGEDEGEVVEKFTYFQPMIGFLTFFYYIVAQVGHLALKEKKDDSNKVLYLVAGIAYSAAMLCSNMALKWVSYPVQVVAKSAKPIPTILLTALIGKRKYTWQKYVFVLMIVVGVAIFIYKPDGKDSIKEKVWYGELLLLGSLILDGLCGGFEERIRKETAPSPFSMMLAMNLVSAVVLVVASACTGEAIKFLSFVQRHPECMQHIVFLAIAGGAGQCFIFYMVTVFGPLPCSIVTTTRKFFTLLCSGIIIAKPPLTTLQWIAAGIVFAALFGDLFVSNRNKDKPEKAEEGELDALNKLTDEDVKLRQVEIQKAEKY